MTRNSDFAYKNGQKISLNNVRRSHSGPYTNEELDQPFVYCYTGPKTKESTKTWDKVIEGLNAERADSKETEIFGGRNLSEMADELRGISGIKAKFKRLLDKLNAPLEANIKEYSEDIHGDISIAWSYASIISKLMRKLDIPVKFHLLVDKNRGAFDESFCLNISI